VDGFWLTFDGFDPGAEGLREALTSTGNGYLCARGAAEWQDADGVHYPGTYVHGGYNRETTILGGLPVLNEDLVNMPNWLVLQLRIEGEDAIRLAGSNCSPTATSSTSGTRPSSAIFASVIPAAGRRH
jgi:trehalose/maltose hydrolase-like predicted phosphorylase